VASASRTTNRIVHGYWSIDFGILIETAQNDLLAFVEQLREIRAAITS
jgi:uncharacterized protein YutE (UPF0331/DUF86 family)